MTCCYAQKLLCHYSFSNKFCWISNGNSNGHTTRLSHLFCHLHTFRDSKSLLLPIIFQLPRKSVQKEKRGNCWGHFWFFSVAVLWEPSTFPCLHKFICCCFVFFFFPCMFVVRLVSYMVFLGILCRRLCLEQTWRLCYQWILNESMHSRDADIVSKL